MKLLHFFETNSATANSSRAFFFFLAASLSILVPTPGRFAFGVVMLLVFNIQLLSGILFSRLIAKLKLTNLQSVLTLIELVSITLLLKQLLILLCPVAALTLGFIMYLPAFSSTLIDILFKKSEPTLLQDLRVKLRLNALFSVVALVYFCLRDLIGYGTLTFIVKDRIAYVQLPFAVGDASLLSFFATIPGAFVLLAIALALYLVMSNRLMRIKRSRV